MSILKKTVAFILSAILVFSGVSSLLFTASADSVSFAEGEAVLTGQSIQRLSAKEATLRFHSAYGGELLRAVTDTSSVPDFTDSVWTQVGNVAENSVNIKTVALNPGAQYVHWAVRSGETYSDVLTNEIPCNGYIFEDFEAYDLNMSTKNEVNYLPFYKNGSTSYGGQANEIISVADVTEGNYTKALCVHGANDSYTGSSDQRMNLPADSGNKITVEFDAVQQYKSGAGTFGIYTQDNKKILEINMDAPFTASSLANAQTDYSSLGYDGETVTGRHHFKIELDLSKGTYDYYIDGNKANSKALFADLKSAPSYIKLYAANLKAGTAYDNIKITVEGEPAITGKGIYRTTAANAEIYFKSSCTGTAYYTVSAESEVPTAEDVKTNGTKVESIVSGTNKISLDSLSNGAVYVNLTVENSAGTLSPVSQFGMPYEGYIFEDNESYGIGVTPESVVKKYSIGSTQYGDTEFNNRVFRANGGLGSYTSYHSAENLALPAYTAAEGKTLFILEADVTPIAGDPGKLFFGKTDGITDYVAGVSFSGTKIASIGAKTNHTSTLDRTLKQTYRVKIVYDAYSKMFDYYIDGVLQNSDPLDTNAAFDPTGINIYTGTSPSCITVDNLVFYITDGSLHHHDYTDSEYVSDGSGKHYRICSICSEKSEYEACKPSSAVTENTVPATCSTEGSYNSVVYCELCKVKISSTPKTLEINPDAHDYGSFTYDGESAKTHTKVCSYNNAHTVTETCNFTSEVTTEPTCTKEGVRTYTCSVCSGTYTEVVEKSAHIFDRETVGEKYIKAKATCESGSVYYKSCVCGLSSEGLEGEATFVTRDKLPHSYTGEIKNNNDGTHSFKCVNGCDDYGNVTACDYVNEGELVTAATCLADAVYTYSCACGAEKNLSKAGTKLAHSYTGDVKDNGDGTHSFKCVNGCDEFGGTVDCAYTKEGELVTAATCLKDAVYTYSCECGAEKDLSKAGTKLDHSYTGAIKDNGDGTHSFQCVNGCGEYGDKVSCTSFSEKVTAPTCTAKGFTTYICNDCGYKYTADETEMLAHTYSVYVAEVTAATCLANTTATYKCTNCTATTVKEVADTKLDHDFSGAIKDNGDGTHSFKCVNGCDEFGGTVDCAYTKEGELVTAATCLADAVYTYSCACGAEKNLSKAGTKLDHSYTGDIKDNGDGTHSFKCVNGCDDYGNATTCDYVNEGELVTAATCLADAVYTYSCECGAEKNIEKVGTKLDHDFSGAIKDNGDGTHSYLCINGCDNYGATADCEYTIEGTEVTAATCLADAVYTYSCECGAEKNLSKAGTKLDHDFSGAIKDNGDGTHSFKCVNGCDEYGATVKCKDFSEEITTPATCTEKGITTYTCTECGYSYTLSNVDALDHSWNEGVITAPATATATGIKTYTCTRENCGATKTETVAKLAVTKVSAKAATNTTAGNKEYYICNGKYYLDAACTKQTTLAAITIPVIEPTFTYGDVDKDGKITAADARLALRASVGLEKYSAGSDNYNACDVDADGKITAADARLILRASVGLEDEKKFGKK